jgi:hypothetical protein
MIKEFRTRCVATAAQDLEHLITFQNFPMFIGATDQPIELDEFHDMCWSISKSSGVIQLSELLPVENVYSGFHSEAVGDVWEQHRQEFLTFIEKNKKKGSVVEMGGSDGKLADEYCRNFDPECIWTIIEPNPSASTSPLNPNITLIEGFIEAELEHLSLAETFIHSHVLEHLYYPAETLQAISKAQKPGDQMIFSIPNLEYYVENHFVNALNFEHTYYLTEPVTEYLLNGAGYVIREKEYYGQHSIFYAAERTIALGADPTLPTSLYKKYREDYLSLVNYYRLEVSKYNQLIRAHDSDVFLFGAHIFSQFLLYMGLDDSQIECILDNSLQKVGRRLYGSTLTIASPARLQCSETPLVILKVGQYFEEVRDQILKINEHSRIIS